MAHVNLYSVYQKMLSQDSDYDHCLGRIAVMDDRMYILEDHHKTMQKMFQDLNGQQALARLDSLKQNPYFTVKDFVDTQTPNYDKLQSPAPIEQKEVEFNNLTWYFKLNGMEKYHTLSAKDSVFSVDGGKSLSDNEVAFLIDALNQGTAEIIYPKVNKNVVDFVQDFEELRKDDASRAKLPTPDPNSAKHESPSIDPEGALKHLETLVQSGHLPAHVASSLRQHIFQDPMTGLGNRYAYEQRSNKNKGEVVASWDLNFLKQINDTHGHETGDHAIKATANAMKEAAKQVPNSRHHRVGGDEMISTFDSPEDAHLFARHFTNNLDKIPPIKGTHKISVSGGIGHDFASADKSLYEAKKQKYKPEGIILNTKGDIDSRNSELAYKTHEMPSMIHSSIKGQEGPVDLGTSKNKGLT